MLRKWVERARCLIWEHSGHERGGNLRSTYWKNGPLKEGNEVVKDAPP